MSEKSYPFPLPHDILAETAVIGSAFLEPELIPELKKILSDDDFYGEACREVWKAEKECFSDGLLDLVTLEAKLRKRGTLEKIGGIRFIMYAVNETPTTEGVMRYAKQIEESGKRRRILKGLAEACESLTEPGAEVEKIGDYVQQVLLLPNIQRQKTYTFSEAYENFETEYSERKKRGAQMPGVSTGFPLLDHMLGGLEKERMYVIGARPGMGKSAFAMSIAYSIARYGRNVIIFSLEMGHKEVVKRIISVAGRINGSKIKNCRLDEKEQEEAKKIKRVLDANLYINDSGNQTMEKITGECISKRAELAVLGKRIECIIIDHMQLLSSEARYSDRRTQIGEASRMCKSLAKEIGCPVVVLSQLSRDLKNRSRKEPQLTDLRESGDIEQDADVVMLLHRDGYYDAEIEDKSAKLIIAKNRDGRIGNILYDWIPEQTRFAERPWHTQRRME